jgi:putative transposase
MNYNPEFHHRKSIRLAGYDYANEGLYFITIRTHNGACLFGEIVGAKNFSPKNNTTNQIIVADNHSPETTTKTNGLGANNHSSIQTPDQPIMILNDAGKIANACWLEIPKHFPHAILHEHIIMPNHVHGIIELTQINVTAQTAQTTTETNDLLANNHLSENTIGTNDVDSNNHTPENKINTHNVGAKNFSPLQMPFKSPTKTIGSIVRGFKIGVTEWVHENSKIDVVWQRNYHEHIIRDMKSYLKISEYIINNPQKWKEDKFFNDSK